MESAGAGRLIAGRYQLDAVIGRGGMGAVWRARDELLCRDVAVKELVWPACVSEEDQRTACRNVTREAQLAARLSHNNVVRIFDIAEEDGCPWIVMELLAYQSLRDLIKAEGPLSPAAAAEVGLGVLAALRAAHQEGIVHRDVKPANILISPERVVLTDFGIARAAGTSALTTAGVLIGSPAYMSPERARGGQSGTPDDLWGLGACLYAAVEGHGPFDRDGGALASLTAVVADDLEPATHAGPLWPVIHGLLRKDPDERLGAAGAERMLRAVASTPTVPEGLALPEGPAVPVIAAAPRQRPPHGPAVLAGSAVLAVIVAASIALGLRPGPGLTSAPRHQTPAVSAPPPAASAGAPAVGTHPSAAASPQPRRPAKTHLTVRETRTRTSPPAAPPPAASPPAPAAANPGAAENGKNGKNGKGKKNKKPGKNGKGG